MIFYTFIVVIIQQSVRKSCRIIST